MIASHTGFPLNGCDVFMYAMDGAMLKNLPTGSLGANSSPAGNVCHLLVTFASDLHDLQQLAKRTAQLPLFQNISRLRLTKRFLRTPTWVSQHSDPAAPPPALTAQQHDFKDLEQLEGWILSHSIDPTNSAPLGCIYLPHLFCGPSLVFYWHHALMDARGGEKLVRLLGESTATETFIPKPPPRQPFRKALQLAQAAKRSLFAKCAPHIQRIPPSTFTAPAYHRIEFSLTETETIDRTAKTVTNGMFPMAMYLAGTVRAARALFPLPEPLACGEAKIFVPVPHDMRRFTKEPSPLSNQVSFIFFSLSAIEHEGLAQETTRVIEQLHESIFAEHHKGILAFFDLLKWLPPSLLWSLIERPAHGHPASMYFSDVGSGLTTLTHFGGAPITQARHYPPVLSPPGFTAIWSRFRDELTVTICYDSKAVSPDQLQLFENRLRTELTEHPDGK